MSNLMWIILSLSVSGSVIAGMLFLLKPILKNKVSNAFFYYAWLIVLLRMVLPISAPVNMIDALMQKAPVIEESVIQERAETREAEQNAVFSRTDQEVPAAESVYQPEQPMDQAAAAVETETAATNAAKTTDLRSVCKAALDWLGDNLIVIWGAGAVIVFCWFAVSYLRFANHLNAFSSLPTEEDEAVFRKLAGRSRVTMLYNSAISTPLMIGLLNPKILVPEREYAEKGQRKQLESLLKHELMHYRRKDILYKWAAVLVSSLHWFNPLMPLIRREIAQQCEFSCDEAVIRKMTPEEKVIYGETLLSFAVRRELPKGIAAATFGEKRTNLKLRLSNIIAYHKKPLWIVAITCVLVIALAGCAVVTGVTSGKKETKEPAAKVHSDALTEETEPKPIAEEEKFTPADPQSETVAEEFGYPCRYFDADGDGEDIELMMSYGEVLAILEELQAAGAGEIADTGVTTGLKLLDDSTREPDQKWIRYVENGETTIRFSFDREDRLSNMAWGENNESDSEALLMATIESEGIQPEFYKGESRDYYLFSQGKGYYALVFTREDETDDIVRISYAMMAENEPEKQKLGEKQPLDINLQHYPTAQELAEMQEQNPSNDHTAEIKYPRKYFDFTPEESGYDTFIELTMSYNEVLSILEEIQKEGNGEITKTGSNDSVSRNEAIPQGKWIRFEEFNQTDSGISREEIGFWFDEDDRLFEIGGTFETDMENVSNHIMPNTIVAENLLPQYYGSDERDIFIFPREKPEYEGGYGIRILNWDTETGALRRYAWAVSLIDYRETYAQESKNNVCILFPNDSAPMESIPLKPEDAISADEAKAAAMEKTGGGEQAYFYRGIAIYNGEYYHAFRKGSIIKEGEDPAYCYVSMDGKKVYEGTNHRI